jgi:hypothetical protein
MENSIPLFLGVDIGGGSNTWVSALADDGQQLSISLQPHTMPLRAVLDICNNRNVVAVTIDAQLTASIDDNSGFRSSDEELKELLPEDCKNWVVSFNSLMAVPVRGQLLAEALSPLVGTILETHPRVCLLFVASVEEEKAVKQYKEKAGQEEVETLWEMWRTRFKIGGEIGSRTDGALDSLVCATIGYLFHRQPAALLKLVNDEPSKTGRGPFYVLRPVWLR